MFISLRTRLIVIYLGLIIVGFGGLTLWTARQISLTIYDDFGNNLQIHALLLANQLLESLEHNPARAMNSIRSSAESLNGQVAIFDRSGNLILNSDQQPAALVNDGDTYTIQPNENGEDTLFVSADVREEDEALGTVQIAVPAAVPQATIRQRWLALGLAFAFVSIVGLVVSLWLFTTLTRPLSRLRDSALKMAGGDLTQRVTDLPNDEIGEVGLAFNEMAAQVESMVAEQRAFASNASHELRTPLTTIRLRTESIQSGELDGATTQRYIKDIDQESRRMSRLVEDLLTISRLEANRLTAGDELIDPARLINTLQKEYAPMATEREIELTLSVDNRPIPPVQANLNHIRIVYGNVIDNALKYTPDGGRVDVALSQVGSFIQLKVVDNGAGISAEDLPQIGKRFYRSDKARSRKTEGSGLGLNLAKSIVDLYGGQFEIASDGLKQGATVTINWPVSAKN